MVIVLFIVVTLLNLALRSSTTLFPKLNLGLTLPTSGLPARIPRLWGQYSPYFAVEVYRSPPPGCVISQVNLVWLHLLSFCYNH
jgi:hypothetical protein